MDFPSLPSLPSLPSASSPGGPFDTLAGAFDGQSRLYSLQGDGSVSALYPEGWTAREGLSRLGEMRIVALSSEASLNLDDLISRPASLSTTLADGTSINRSGLIRQAEMLGGDGTLTRYRLTVVPWLWLATQRRASRIFEGAPILDIVQRILSAYAPYRYRLAPDVEPALADLAPRDYTTQYRETDYAFLCRVLAEAGLGWTAVEQEGAAPAASAGGASGAAPSPGEILIFADSRNLPEDTQSAGPGVLFQRAGSTEEHDAVQALARRRRMAQDRVTLLGWHASAKVGVAGEALAPAGAGAGASLEYYDTVGHGAFANQVQAARQARLIMESAQAHAEVFVGHASVRSFRSGTRFTLQQMSPLGPADEAGFQPVFALDRMEHVGVNNLPKETQAALTARLGALDPWLTFDDAAAIAAPGGDRDEPAGYGGFDAGPFGSSMHATAEPMGPDAQTLAQAHAVGYGNRFEAVRCDRPWRPPLHSGRGARVGGAATAHGVHSAVVVNEEGADTAAGAREVHRNLRGDIRVRFAWQGAAGDGVAHSRWVRVAQRQAGSGMGMTFVPRVGQEVLVRFVDEDIDQPVVIGGLYNGVGEGGSPATPGGRQSQPSDLSVFANARDAKASAQANITGGHAPAWHGAGPSDSQHRNAAALSGFKSQEFGGDGYSHAVFDDSDGQLRTQLKTTQAATELNLGHLIHQAGNYRGALRGVGAELRTDGYGAVRAGAGVLVSSYLSGNADGAGDMTAAQALARQSEMQADTWSAAAAAHQGAALAASAGAQQAGKSALDDQRAPLAGLTQSVSGMVAGASLPQARADAGAKQTRTGDGQIPHLTEPLVVIAAKAGLTQIAGQHFHVVSGETVHWGAGQDMNLAVVGQMRLHAEQAISLVGGVQQAGAGNTGLQLIAAQGAMRLEAQDDEIGIRAKDGVRVASRQGKVDMAAPRKIRIAVEGGASIVLEDGNITVTAPGRIDVKAGNKVFEGPARMSYPLPAFAQSTPPPIKLGLRLQDMPGAHGVVPEGQPWRIVQVNSDVAAPLPGGRVNPALFHDDEWREVIFQGTTPASGELALTAEQQTQLNARVSASPGDIWFISGLTALAMKPARWSVDGDQPAPEKILDALNFAGNGAGLSQVRSDWLAQHAQADAQVQGINNLKPKTDA